MYGMRKSENTRYGDFESSRIWRESSSRRRRCLASVVGILLLNPSIGRSTAWEDEEIREGFHAETNLSGGESQSYKLLVEEGDYIDAVIQQKGIDVVVALVDPNGDTVTEVDSPNGSYGPEQLMAVTRVAGSHRLNVRALTPGQSGQYELKIEAMRQPTRKDLGSLSAYILTREARQLRLQNTASSLQAASAKYREILEICRDLEDLSCLADSYNELGISQAALGKRKDAITSYQQALSVWEKAGDRQGQATALTSLGATFESIGDPKRALEFYNRALPLIRETHNLRSEAVLLNNVGWVYHVLGNPRLALETLEQALQIRRQTANLRGEAITLLNLAVVHENVGEIEKSILSNSKALEISTKTGDKKTEAIALNNLGSNYLSIGESQIALDLFTKSLQLAREMQDTERAETSLSNIGVIYGSLREAEKALSAYEEALKLSRDINDRRGEATTLHNMGRIHEENDRPEQALRAYEQALNIWIDVGYRLGEAMTLLRLGKLKERVGELETASEIYLKALALQQRIGDKANEAQTRFAMSKLARQRSDLSGSVSQIQNALRLIEELRAGAGPGQLRASFLASKRDYYGFYIDLLMELDRLEPRTAHALKAFEVSERAKGRSLLDILSEAGGKIRRGADPELLEHEESLQRAISLAAREQENTPQREISSGESDLSSKELDGLLRDLETVRAEIRARSPKYAALTQPEPLRAEEIQALLEQGDLLLSYFLGEERSFVWAVTRSSLTAHEIPRREEIESAAKELHDLLSQSDKRLARRPTEQAANRLADMILAPVRKLLGKNRLVIVADGALHYIPFAALPDPARPGQPLVVEHEIVNLPSASVLALLRKETGQRAPAPREVAILADPVFRLNDPRVRPQTASLSAEPPAEPGIVLRAAKDVGLDGFPRLRYTREEADAIASLVEPGQVLKALDFDASKETATSADLSRYRILHFATHGLLDTRRPELSGLVLSLVDRQGRPRDGFLRLHEIYNLDLPADLVVLSGCETALGKEVRGEGLMAITRGFMYAGSPAVVASLWQIDDRSTGELMKRFYRGMVKEGLSAPAALRKAQVSLWKDKPTEPPYFWAGFVFQGDWESSSVFSRD